MGIASVCYLVAAIFAALAMFGVGSSRASLGWGAVGFIAFGLLLSSGFPR